MKYLILSSQRSGSDLLRHSLIHLFEEHSDGPDEWIMHPFTRKNLNLPDDLHQATDLILNQPQLLIDRMTPDTHRKVMYSHLLQPKALPKGVPIIHLIRKDSWAQAKSFWVMKQKKLPPHVKDESFQKIQDQHVSIALDYEHVGKIAKKIYYEKAFWFGSLLHRPQTLTLYYEDDLSDITIFMNQTLPKIETFLDKKHVQKAFEFPLKKTSSLYTIENLKPNEETKYSQKYYFEPKSFYSKWCYFKMKAKFKLKQIYNP